MSINNNGKKKRTALIIAAVIVLCSIAGTLVGCGSGSGGKETADNPNTDTETADNLNTDTETADNPDTETETADNPNAGTDNRTDVNAQPAEPDLTADTEKSASSLDELSRLGLYDNDMRLQYIRAFVTGDIDALERLCGVEKGMYENYRTLKLSGWQAWIDADADYYENLRFAFYPTQSDIEAFKVNVRNDGFAVCEGMTGAYLYSPEAPESYGEAADELYEILANHILLEFPTTDDMDDYTRFQITCCISGKLGDAGKTTEKDFKDYAKKHFGIEDFTPEKIHVEYGCAHGGSSQILDVIGSEEKNGETIVTVQFYADMSKTVKSHIYQYTMKKVDGEWTYTGCQEIRHSQYEPACWSM
ncbi:MAG: hypothetical protein GX628_04915 [Clostridiales bacterium]|nr:hypothetical protein [Clostridiales bacterium]